MSDSPTETVEKLLMDIPMATMFHLKDMTVKQQIEILSSVSNAVIAKHCDRIYPGVLIQGDTLRIWGKGDRFILEIIEAP